MKNKRTTLILITLVLSLSLASCGTLINPSSWPGISVEGDFVYVANGSHIYALQLSNGTERWRFPAEAQTSISFYSRPVSDGEGHIYFGSYSQSGNNGNNIYKLDQQNGSEIWHFERASNRYIASPLIADGIVYAPNADYYLYLLTTDGTWLQDWIFKGEEPLWAQPQLEEGVLYLTGMDHHVYAIDAQSGDVLWVTEDTGSAIAGEPLLGDNGLLYVGTFGSEILAIEKNSGQIQWRAAMTDWVWGTPVLLDGNLVVGDQSGAVVALDPESGEEIWSMRADGGVLGTLLIHEGSAYFGTETGKIYRVMPDASGEWDFTILYAVEGQVYSSLVYAEGKILIGVSGGSAIVAAIDLDGTDLWEFTPEK